MKKRIFKLLVALCCLFGMMQAIYAQHKEEGRHGNIEALQKYTEKLKYYDGKSTTQEIYFGMQWADSLLAEQQHEHIKNAVLREKATLLGYLVNEYITQSDSAQVFNYLQIRESTYNVLKDSKGLRDCKRQRAAFLLQRDNPFQALKLSMNYLEEAKQRNKKEDMAFWYLNIGRIYTQYEHYDQGLQNGQHALSVYCGIGDTSGITTTLRFLGGHHVYTKNIERIDSFYLQAERLLHLKKDSFALRDLYNGWGNTHLKLNSFERAITYFERSNQISEKCCYDPTYDRANCGNIGRAYVGLGNVNQALVYHHKALRIAHGIQEKLGQINWVWYLLANDYFLIGKYDSAKVYIDSTLALTLPSKGHTEQKIDAELLASKIDSALGQYKTSLAHYKQFVYLQDGLQKEEIGLQATRDALHREFDQLQLEEKAKQQVKEARIASQLKTQKIIRNAFITESLLLLLLIVLLINRNKLKRKIEMESIRNKLSRDLHDDIGSTLSSINILSKTAQSSLHQTHDEKIKASLEKINERSQRLLHNMSDIIWNIKPGNDQMEDVIIRMREYATTLFDVKNISYEFNFPKEIMDCKLSMEVKNNLYLIFKEAVNNLVKHAQASRVVLSLLLKDKHIHLIIEDNGKGFDRQSIQHVSGLNNMQHRAEEMGGRFNIISSPQQGTRIEVYLPRFC